MGGFMQKPGAPAYVPTPTPDLQDQIDDLVSAIEAAPPGYFVDLRHEPASEQRLPTARGFSVPCVMGRRWLAAAVEQRPTRGIGPPGVEGRTILEALQKLAKVVGVPA